MRALRLLAAVVVAVLAAGGVALVVASRYVQSPEFKARILATAREIMGSEVRIDGLSVSLFSGATLRGVTVANPSGFSANLLTVDELVLRYRLLPLLRRQVEVERLILAKPVITLVQNERSEWNYDRLGEPARPSPSRTPPMTPPAAGPGPAPLAAPLDITLSRLALENGELLMLTSGEKPLLRVRDIDLRSAVRLAGAGLSGDGEVRIDTIDTAGSLFVRQISAPVTLSTEAVRLSPVRGKLAGGDVSGDLALRLAGGLRYLVDLEVRDSDVATLLREARSRTRATGKLRATATLQGTGGLDTLGGQGKATVARGTLAGAPLQDLLAALLQLPELRELRFDEALVEFTVANNVLHTPVIRISSPLVKITGRGSVALADYSLDHDFTVAFARDALARAPREVRNLFAERPDGSRAVEFRVWGPYQAPRTDLGGRLVRSGARQLLEREIEKGLKKLLR